MAYLKLNGRFKSMKIGKIDVNETIQKARDALENEKNISNTTKIIFELLLTVIVLLMNRLGLNSKNSSKPPSTDNNKNNSRDKNNNGTNKRGGQNGHQGTTLDPVEDPDEVSIIKFDRRTLPRGDDYTHNGYVTRQVFNIKISRFVIEYRAEKWVNQKGDLFIAPFPEGVTHRAQYGASIKARAVYLAVEQMIPYERIQEQFKHDANITISTGSFVNFKREVSAKLKELKFDEVAKYALVESEVIHSDETGINIGGKRLWLHGASNGSWSWFEPHKKRGGKAMNDIGILPLFLGLLCHDHWKSYFAYPCKHSLCNAHHDRELIRAFEQDGQKWAKKMRAFLLELNKEVKARKNSRLSKVKIKERIKTYRKILAAGARECPETKPIPGQKKRPAQTKSRNLLERLRDYEDEVLRFMVESLAPFTNNLGERDIRMTKVQQKISGCFVSMKTAKEHYIIKSYISTCKKNDISASDALTTLFENKLPDFIQEKAEEILDSS